MSQRDENGRRIKWTRAEKKMVREMKTVRLDSRKCILSYRSKAERLRKTAMENPPKADAALPPHLIIGPQRTHQEMP